MKKIFEDGQWIVAVAVIFPLLGFILLSFPEIEHFFGERQFLFYLIFFLPICLIILAFLLGVATLIIGYLYEEYRKLRYQGTPLYMIILRIILIFSIILLGLGVLFYLNFGELF